MIFRRRSFRGVLYPEHWPELNETEQMSGLKRRELDMGDDEKE
jgi:hypothetical protein